MIKYRDVVLDRRGDVQIGLTVKVYAAGTTDLSTIYSDDGITLIDQTNAPLTTDSDGVFEFWVDSGDYKIIVTGTGFSTVTIDDITIGSDAAALQAEVDALEADVSAIIAQIGTPTSIGNGTNQVALGNGTTTQDGTNSSVAVGYQAFISANSTSSVAIGDQATVGENAQAASLNSVAIGPASEIGFGSDRSLAIGYGAEVADSVDDAVAIGDASVGAASGVAIGLSSAVSAAGTNGVAVGRSTSVSGASGVAVGQSSIASAASAMAVGSSASASASAGTAMGSGAAAASTESVAVGYSAGVAAGSDGSIAIGSASDIAASALYGIAVGHAAAVTTGSDYAVAIGDTAIATGDHTVAIGSGANTAAANCVAIGRAADSGTGSGNIVIGNSATNSGDNIVSVGHGAAAGGNTAVALGYATSAGAAGAVAVGGSATVGASATNGIAVGTSATVSAAATNGIAIGNTATAGHAGAVVIGDASSTAIDEVTLADGSGTVKARWDSDEVFNPVAGIKLAASALSALEINANAATLFTKSISADTTFTLTNMAAGKAIYLQVTNDGTARVLTFGTGFSGLEWPYPGTQPASTTGVDLYRFIQVGSKIHGELVGTGTASVLTTSTTQTIWVPAAAMTPRTTNGAASATTETSTNKRMIVTLNFDASTAEYAQFEVGMPKGWNDGTVTAEFIWSATTIGDVVWALQAVAVSDADTLDVAFGTAVTVTDAVAGANQLNISAATSAITVGGSPANGDTVVFQAYRDAANGSDTLAADARLHGIRIFYTSVLTDA
jgi:hypothetical protein